jgi:dihydrofolate reductase
MGRIVYGMLTSLDGYIAGRENGPSLPAPEAALHQYFNAVMRETAVALYGRRLYEVMQAWEIWDKEPAASAVEIEFARLWRETPKVVVSTTLKSVGPNARLVRDDVERAVRSLKAETGGTIEVGGAGLAASLSRLRMIDEYQLFLQPVVLGGGKPFFDPAVPLALKLLGAERLAQDVVMLRYSPAD